MVRETVKIVITGHVDHGKSTLIGRLLLDTGSVPGGKMKDIKRIASELGKDAELSFIIDQLKEEREGALTIDTAEIPFRSKKRDYIIVDVPGHKEFIKNMVTGSNVAEAAIIVIDAMEGIGEQTKRHAELLALLDIKEIMVAINKIDLTGYSEKLYNNIKKEISEFLKSTKLNLINILPISAKKGENILNKSHNIRWFRGPTFLEGLDSINLKRQKIQKPFRFPIQDIYSIDEKRIMVGEVISGSIKKGDRVKVYPGASTTVIKDIIVFERNLRSASKGDNIGLILQHPICTKRGNIIAEKNTNPLCLQGFSGKVFWMSDKPLYVGEELKIRLSTQEIQGVAQKITEKMDSNDLSMGKKKTKTLENNNFGIVHFKTKNTIIVEDYNFIKELGRFSIERDSEIKGFGIINF